MISPEPAVSHNSHGSLSSEYQQHHQQQQKEKQIKLTPRQEQQQQQQQQHQLDDNMQHKKQGSDSSSVSSDQDITSPTGQVSAASPHVYYNVGKRHDFVVLPKKGSETPYFQSQHQCQGQL